MNKVKRNTNKNEICNSVGVEIMCDHFKIKNIIFNHEKLLDTSYKDCPGPGSGWVGGWFLHTPLSRPLPYGDLTALPPLGVGVTPPRGPLTVSGHQPGPCSPADALSRPTDSGGGRLHPPSLNLPGGAGRDAGRARGKRALRPGGAALPAAVDSAAGLTTGPAVLGLRTRSPGGWSNFSGSDRSQRQNQTQHRVP